MGINNQPLAAELRTRIQPRLRASEVDAAHAQGSCGTCLRSDSPVIWFQPEERTLLPLPLADGRQECTYRDLARRLPEGRCADR